MMDAIIEIWYLNLIIRFYVNFCAIVLKRIDKIIKPMTYVILRFLNSGQSDLHDIIYGYHWYMQLQVGKHYICCTLQSLL